MKYFLLSLLLLFTLISLTQCSENDPNVKPAAADPLFTISDESAGENCETGGVMIAFGFDDDENGQLNASEIKDISYICDGLSENVRVVSTEEPSGENCQNGGVKLLIGLDNNDNGELDTDEVQQVSFICNGQSAEVLGKNHLFLTGSITDEEAQAKINNTVGQNTQFVTIKNTTNLKSVDLSMIENLIELQVVGNDSLAAIDLSQLLSVDDGVLFEQNSDTISLDASSLSTIYGTLGINNNDCINFDLSSLVNLNTLVIDDLLNLTISFPLLEGLQILEIKNNVGGTITCEFPELLYLGSYNVTDNLYVRSIDVSIPKITTVSEINYNNNFSYDLSSFSPGFEQLETIGIAYITNNACLPEQLSLSNLTHFDYLLFSGNSYNKQLDFPVLTETTGSLSVRDNTGVTALSLPAVTQMTNLELRNNPELTTIAIPLLEGIQGMVFNGNEMLPGVTAESLQSISSLNFTANEMITNVQFPVLESISSLVFLNNTVLDSIEFESLLEIDNLQIIGNEGLEDIQLPKVTHINEGLSVYENGVLTNINLNALETIGDFDVYLDLNAFDSNEVNDLLATLVSLTPPISGVTIELMQSSPAPPSGQGLTDKATLVENGNTVNTD